MANIRNLRIFSYMTAVIVAVTASISAIPAYAQNMRLAPGSELDIIPDPTGEFDFIAVPRDEADAYHNKNEKKNRSLNEKRESPRMHSRIGRCEMVGISPFEDQIFPCKIDLETGRGWWIFIQPPGAGRDSPFEGSYLSFNGYSEECGFGVGCPFMLEVQNLSKALQKESSVTKTPTDFYIRKWDRSEIKLIFDMGIRKSFFTFKADRP